MLFVLADYELKPVLFMFTVDNLTMLSYQLKFLLLILLFILLIT